MGYRIITLITGVILILLTAPVHSQEMRLAFEGDMAFARNLECKYKFMSVNELPQPKFLNRISFDAGLKWKLDKHFSFAAACRFSYRMTEDEGVAENDFNNRISFDQVYKNKKLIKNLKLVNRLRLQAKADDGGFVKPYLRNRLKCSFEYSKKLEPFIAIEPYYSFSKDRIKTVRFYSGSQIEIMNNSIELFLITELMNKSKLSTAFIFGVSYHFQDDN